MKPRPDEPPDLTAAGVRQVQEGIASIDEVRARFSAPSWTVTTTLSLSPVQVSELAMAIQRKLLEQAKRNRRWPGSAA